MSIDLCREVVADEIEVDDEIDLDGDEYGDNSLAMSAFAVVKHRVEWYDADNYPWVTFRTTQGEFDMPAGHLVKLKVVE